MSKERQRSTNDSLNKKIDTSNQILEAKIDGNRSAIDDLQKTIGNGGYQGIKHEIEELKVHCAGEMSSVKTNLSNHQREIDEVKKRVI